LFLISNLRLLIIQPAGKQFPPSLFVLTLLGAIDSHIALTALSLIPFAILGGQLGCRLFSLVPQAQFQRSVPLLVLGTAMYAVVTTLW